MSMESHRLTNKPNQDEDVPGKKEFLEIPIRRTLMWQSLPDMPEDILQASGKIAGQIKHSMTNGKIIMFTDVGISFYILTLLCLIKH